jgi:hypothetical protein
MTGDLLLANLIKEMPLRAPFLSNDSEMATIPKTKRWAG